MSRILIRGGRVVTMNEKQEIPECADVLIDGGTIVSIAPSSDGTQAAADMIIDAYGKVVMPGFVQSHVHLCQTLFRGQADDLELMDWLKLRIWPLEGAHDKDSIYWSAMLGITELIKGGTTSIIDMETVHHTDSAFSAILDSGIRATSGKVMMDYGDDVPGSLMESTEDSLNESETLMKKWHMRDGGRIRYAFAPRFVVSCTDKLLVRVRDMARANGVIIHTHASENRGEIELVMADRGMRNIECLNELGLLGADVVLAHCIWLDDEEMELIRDSETKVVHCPSSNLKLASGVAKIPEMLDMGVFVSLGADGAPCNNNLDAFMEMRLAALIHKPRLGPTAMPAATVLRMATRGGAEAMGVADEIGSIEPGKRADIIILDLDRAHVAPTRNVDLVSRIVYEARAGDVETTIVDGRVLMHERRLTGINEEEVVCEANKALERVLRRSGCAPSDKK
ncbi:MAG: 5'-deoxyadenosine deaminase [Firmicutes bacterium]|jgi:5-methylthioadenosine/S-adenosylhomocysteine deaminase|nr:5'-deoxyadenosine deaminase [Bacillota bacterium]